MKVLVCDDYKDQCEKILANIGEADQTGIDVESVFEEDLTNQLENLFDKVDACVDEPNNYKVGDQLSFDTADVVILDNNLANLEIKGTRLTAESIAGYVRAFTAAPYVVSLNKNPDVDFDLRYLVGDYATRADLALNDRHLPNPSLWTGKRADAKKGFLPWYWPILATVADRRREQIAFVEKHLTDSVFDALEIPKEAIGFLSLHARGALSPDANSDGVTDDGIPIDEVTFLEVFEARDRSLPAKREREKLSRSARAGNAVIRRIVSRVVAADIDLWFRLDVLGPQEALVDVPHLLMRMPFLLGDGAGDMENWNGALGENDVPFGMERSLYDDHLAEAKFEHDIWVPSPSFWWPKLKENEMLNELFLEAKQEWPDVVFCEDCSEFRERSPKNGFTPPVEFSAEFEGSWARRYVARLDGVHYTPRSRFAI